MKFNQYAAIACSCLLMFVVTNACGCECWTNKSISPEDLWTNDVIFKGQIISIKSTSIKGSMWTQALFQVDKVILSKTSIDTVSVYTPSTTESCGLAFKQNSKWLIFARGRNFLESTQCSHSLEQRGIEGERIMNSAVEYLRRMSEGDHVVKETIEGHDGTFELVGEISNGSIHGKWFKIAGSDTISSLNFYYGKQVGHQFDRSRTGRVEERVISYVNGDKIESVKFYSIHSGDVLIVKYKNGLLHGPYESKFSDTYKTGEFVEGKESGEWFTYSNGTLVSRRFYVDGKAIE